LSFRHFQLGKMFLTPYVFGKPSDRRAENDVCRNARRSDRHKR